MKTLAFALCVSLPGLVQANCTIYQDEVDLINARYNDIYQEIKAKSADLAKDSEKLPDDTMSNVIGHKVDVTFKEKRITFDTPSLSMKRKRIVFGVPQTSMKLRTISFDTPKTTFVIKKTGQYSEVFCEDTCIELPFGGKTKGVPKCTTRWSDIKTKVPEIRMERTEIKTKIPEFRWDNTEIVLDIPEFFMERQEWILKIPEIRSTDVKAEREVIQERSQAITQKSETTQSQHRSELISNTTQLYNCLRLQIEAKKSEVIRKIDKGIQDIETSIKEIESYGIDPRKVQSPEGTIDLIVLRDTVVQKKSEAITQFDEALASIAQHERDALAKI